jgi:hypothetical protein
LFRIDLEEVLGISSWIDHRWLTRDREECELEKVLDREIDFCCRVLWAVFVV